MCSGACSLVPSTCYLFLEACCGPWWAGQMRFGDPLTHAGSVNVCSGHPSMHAVSLCWFSWALDMLALGLRLVCLLFWVYSHKRIMYVYVCVHVIHWRHSPRVNNICTDTCIHLHVGVHVIHWCHSHVKKKVHIRVCMHIYINIYKYMYIYVYIYIYL